MSKLKCSLKALKNYLQLATIRSNFGTQESAPECLRCKIEVILVFLILEWSQGWPLNVFYFPVPACMVSQPHNKVGVSVNHRCNFLKKKTRQNLRVVQRMKKNRFYLWDGVCDAKQTAAAHVLFSCLPGGHEVVFALSSISVNFGGTWDSVRACQAWTEDLTCLALPAHCHFSKWSYIGPRRLTWWFARIRKGLEKLQTRCCFCQQKLFPIASTAWFNAMEHVNACTTRNNRWQRATIGKNQFRSP